MTDKTIVRSATLALGAALLIGCAPQQSRQAYLINEQSAPATEQQAEANSCSRILAEIQRLEKAPGVDVLNTHGGSGQPMSFKSNKAEQIEKLEARASRMGCYAAREATGDSAAEDEAGDRDGPPTQRQRLSFDQCFAKCRELTRRSAEQCFDACR